MAKPRSKTTKKKIKKNIPVGHAYVVSSFNNTIITVTDVEGNAITWSSAGALGFKGSKKSTPYAAQLVAKAVIESAQAHGVKSITLFLKGRGPGKDASLRVFQASEIDVKIVKDITPVAHNGCRKKKKFLFYK